MASLMTILFKHLKEIIATVHQLFQRIEEEEILPNLYYEATIISNQESGMNKKQPNTSMKQNRDPRNKQMYTVN